MNISVLGIDLGKNICSVVGLDSSGAVVLRRRATRPRWPNSLRASSPWRPAAARIILGAFLPAMGMTSG